jgi:hypothetical protein
VTTNQQTRKKEYTKTERTNPGKREKTEEEFGQQQELHA